MSDLGTKSSGPVQPTRGFVATRDVSQMRSFKSAWFRDYRWLEYSIQKQAAFCFPCRIFGPRRSSMAFVSDSFDNWRKALEKFADHAKSRPHKDAMTSWTGFRSQPPINQQVAQYPDHVVEANRRFIKVILRSVLLLAKQELALRYVALAVDTVEG